MKHTIRSYHGGLGDELQFSTLPEMLVRQGHSVSLYTGGEVRAARNQEILDFVWGKNPFVTGSSSRAWTIGDTPTRGYANRHNDFIMNWEDLHGLPPTNSLPKIYYAPKNIPGLAGLVDLSAISHKYNPELVREAVRELMKKSGLPFRQIRSAHQTNCIVLPDIEFIDITGLEAAADAICSCHQFISLSSGLHALGAAVRRINPDFLHTCLIPNHAAEWVFESRKFVFPAIEYVIS